MTYQDCWLKIDDMAHLTKGWNGYDAAPPFEIARRNAECFCACADRLGCKPARVEPSAMGGVGVTFEQEAGFRSVCVEFYNDGKAHCLFSDDESGELETIAVFNNDCFCGYLIGKIECFLEVGV